jgi:chemotaxis protein MotB
VNNYLLALAAFAITAVVLCGCAVPQHKYEELKEQHDNLLQEYERITQQYKDLETQNEIQANKLAGQQARLAAAQGIINDMNKEKPPEAPQEGWKTNPKTGGIVLENEIMFSAGSSRLSKKGKDTLKRLALLLNSAKYGEYFVRVDGHTDNVPVIKTVKENKDNWFLSVKRAHAVLAQLKEHGVGPGRLFLAGYGEYQPIVPNRPGKKGTPANRRVEIVLVKEAKTDK